MKKGFLNFIYIIIALALIIVFIRFALQKANPKLERKITDTISQKVSQGASKLEEVSEELFKDAKYRLTFSDKELGVKEFTLDKGKAVIGEALSCGIVKEDSKILAYGIDKVANRGVVTIYCNRGANIIDVFLVAFKDLNKTPISTDAVDVRLHPLIKDRKALRRITIEKIAFASNGELVVNISAIPDALSDKPGYEQVESEAVTINYRLDEEGKITVKE
jgi:hypothetical protein